METSRDRANATINPEQNKYGRALNSQRGPYNYSLASHLAYDQKQKQNNYQIVPKCQIDLQNGKKKDLMHRRNSDQNRTSLPMMGGDPFKNVHTTRYQQRSEGVS